MIQMLGLSWFSMLSVLGAAAAIVVALYLLRTRKRRVTVPYLRLWENILAEKASSRLFARLKRILSLLLALVIVTLICLALGDPHLGDNRRNAHTVVILVDASASMNATDVKPNRFAEAKKKTNELIEALGSNDRMLVAQMDSATVPLSPLTNEVHLLREATRKLAATDGPARIDPAFRLAADVLRGQPNPAIVIVSDGAIGDLPTSKHFASDATPKISWIQPGKSDRNVGIRVLSARRYPLDKSQVEVLVELWNPSPRNENVELTLLGDDRTLDVQSLTLPKGSHVQHFLHHLSGVDTRLEAKIALTNGSHDDLSMDDHAYTRIPTRKRARILVVSDGNLYLQAALLLDDYLQVSEVTPAEYDAKGSYDVIIFDGVVPAVLPQSHMLFMYPAASVLPQGPFAVKGVIPRPFFDRVDPKHPIARSLALSDVNVADALDVTLGPGDRVIAGSTRVPLIIAGTRNQKRMAALTFDIRRSDLVMRMAWPLLLLNTIDWFVEDRSNVLSSFVVGDAWSVPVPAGTKQAVILDPLQEKHDAVLEGNHAIFRGTKAGFYTLLTDTMHDTFAANVASLQETPIHPSHRSEKTRAVEVLGKKRLVQAFDPNLWIYFVAVVLALLIAEWLTYHRRWTT